MMGRRRETVQCLLGNPKLPARGVTGDRVEGSGRGKESMEEAPALRENVHVVTRTKVVGMWTLGAVLTRCPWK